MPVNPFTKEGEHNIVDLQVSLKDSEYIFGFINISHISYDKLEEIFKGQIGDERFLFDDIGGYVIDEQIYNPHKSFLIEKFLSRSILIYLNIVLDYLIKI